MLKQNPLRIIRIYVFAILFLSVYIVFPPEVCSELDDPIPGLFLQPGLEYVYRVIYRNSILDPENFEDERTPATPIDLHVISGKLILDPSSERLEDSTQTVRVTAILDYANMARYEGDEDIDEWYRNPELPLPIEATFETYLHKDGKWEVPKEIHGISDATGEARRGAGILGRILYGLDVCLPQILNDPKVWWTGRPIRWIGERMVNNEPIEYLAESREIGLCLFGTSVLDPEDRFPYSTVMIRMDLGHVVNGEIAQMLRKDGRIIMKNILDVTLIEIREKLTGG